MIFTTSFDAAFDELLNGNYDPFKEKRNYKINKSEEGYELLMTVPGLVDEDINVDIDRMNSQLIISTDQDFEFVNKFSRVFKIGKAIETKKVSAKVSEGILKVFLPYSEDQSTVKIL